KKEVPKALMLTENRSTPRRKLPTDPKQLISVGYSEMEQGDLDLAIDCLIEAVKKVPNNPDARRYLAHAFARSGDLESAASQFRALMTLQVLRDDDALIYAEALERQRDLRSAVDVLTGAMLYNPENVQVRMRLAKLYYQAGRTSEADQISQEGLQRA